MVQFARTLDRPFTVRYNPYTQSVEILDTPLKCARAIKDIQNQLNVLQYALAEISSRNTK